MITLARFHYEYLLPHVGLNADRFKIYGYSIKVSGSRMECLKRSPVCVNCNRVGKVWLLQVRGSMSFDKPHFNLYSLRAGKPERMMTRDHIIPSSKGGTGCMDNLQTMCDVCYNQKGDAMPGQVALSQNQYFANVFNLMYNR